MVKGEKNKIEQKSKDTCFKHHYAHLQQEIWCIHLIWCQIHHLPK